MADPTDLPMNITIKSSATTYAGERVRVTNLTSGGTLTGEFNANGECIIHPVSGWNTGDSVIAEVHGRLQGNKTVTLKASGVTLTITTAADTASSAVDL